MLIFPYLNEINQTFSCLQDDFIDFLPGFLQDFRCVEVVPYFSESDLGHIFGVKLHLVFGCFLANKTMPTFHTKKHVQHQKLRQVSSRTTHFPTLLLTLLLEACIQPKNAVAKKTVIFRWPAEILARQPKFLMVFAFNGRCRS